MKDKLKFLLPAILMVMLAISMWPGMSEPLARALGLTNGLNFSAAYALAFCAGVYFPSRLKWALPLAMFIAINILTNIHYGVSPFHRYLIVKILAFSALIWLGTRYSARHSTLKLVGGGLIGAFLFYLITNTASWFWDPAYTKTLGGWLQALTIGTPGFPPTIAFLFNSLLSGGLFTGLFVGAMKLTEESDQKADESETAPGEAEQELVPTTEKSEA